MKYAYVLVLCVILAPWSALAQEVILSPSSTQTLDAQGRGIAIVEFDACDVPLDGLLVNAMVEWEPADIDVEKPSTYWAHILEPEASVELGENAWERLLTATTSLWDINPEDPERDAAKRIRFILPDVVRILRQGTECSVRLLIGSDSVSAESLALVTIVLKLHTVPGVGGL